MNRVDRKVWLHTPCPVAFHHHYGPTAECERIMARYRELGDEARTCWSCREPAGRVCGLCGGERYVPQATTRSVPARERVGRYQPDSLGCVERVALVERAYLNGGYE